jgi:hypothetical protein
MKFIDMAHCVCSPVGTILELAEKIDQCKLVRNVISHSLDDFLQLRLIQNFKPVGWCNLRYNEPSSYDGADEEAYLRQLDIVLI